MRDDPFGWVGQTIDGKYRIDAVVGEGGFGVVYHAHHLGFGGPVAIKCLKLPRALAPAQRERIQAAFLAEGQLLHRLSRGNAGIVQALDVGGATAPSGAFTPYLALEWLDGASLEDDLAARLAQGAGPRPLPDALALLEPAFSALATAHAEGIAHRDVKPANLFLASVGGRRTLKVLDFGIAKVLGETLSLTQALQSTGGGEQAFTPQYAAPEQFDRGFGATGPWTDVYALALVLVEVTTARPALQGDSVAQLFLCTSDRGARPTLRRRGLAVSDAVEAVIERALAVDPRRRYVGALELFDALLAALGTSRGELMPRSRGSLPDAIGSRPSSAVATAQASWAIATATPMSAVSSPTAAASSSTDDPVSMGLQGRHAATNPITVLPPTLADAPLTHGVRRRGWLLGLGGGLVVLALGGAAAVGLARGKNATDPLDDVAIGRPSDRRGQTPAGSEPQRPPDTPAHLASLAGTWTSDSGRVYDAVAAGGELEFRVHNPDQFQGQGYFAGDVRFALSSSADGGPTGPFVVRDVLRPFPPEGVVYDTGNGSSQTSGASHARATCVGTWTAVDGRPLSATLDGSRLVVELVKVFPTRAMFGVLGTTVMECRGLVSAPVTRVRSVLVRK